jgi:hypothetical protein
MLLQNEAMDVDSFLYAKLAADSALLTLLGGTAKIYSEIALQGVAPPYVLMSLLASVDRNAIGADQRIFTQPVYAIRGVTTGTTFTTASAIADRLDAVLVGAKGTTGGGTLSILGMFREEIIRRVEVVDGIRYNYCGGRFRCFVTGV